MGHRTPITDSLTERQLHADRLRRRAVRPDRDRDAHRDGPGRSRGSPPGDAQYPEYEDDTIWQANLKDARITLPEGLRLSPGGGVGLEACTFEEFGVDPSPDKQLNRRSRRVPAGSQIGTLEVRSPVLPDSDRGQGVLRPASAAPAARPRTTRGSSSC